MPLPNPVIVVIVDDQLSHAENFGDELRFASRRERVKVEPHAYRSAKDFLDDLGTGKFDRIDLVVLDEDARDGGGARDQGSATDLPTLRAIRNMSVEPTAQALRNTKFVIYTGKLNPDEVEDLRRRITPLGGVDVWLKDRVRGADLLERVISVLEEPFDD